MDSTPTPIQISEASLAALRAFARTMSTACLLGRDHHAEAILLESVAAGRLLLHLLSAGVLTPTDLKDDEEDEAPLEPEPGDDDERTIVLQSPPPVVRGPYGPR